MKLTDGSRWGAGAGLLVVLLSAGTAYADTQVPLPNGDRALTTATGVQVDLSRTGERAVISPSLASNGLSRTAAMSGVVYATVHGAKSGTLATGYVIGCQVDLSGGVGIGGDMYVDTSSAYPELTPSINLVPGAVKVVKFDTKTLDPTAGAIGVTYSDRAVQVSGCAGYAQARAVSILTVQNDKGSAEVSLYGKPFSIG
ncbi:MspA family porin [Nocardia miyunensis]|uniref:MspA family porin n=1 Tax=Nocardia miyunensis TaxID=282684 RepID=UPI000835711E|nr:MspA family porin [Nocardia miyunensis]